MKEPAGVTPSEDPDKPLVFVTVGTDHHPFDRVIRWIDGWLEAGGADRARCFVQTGTSTPPRLAEWKEYVSHEEMERLTGLAVVTVCHGGPGTIMECRRLGTKPIVVPRRHALGEHVDDHQVRFARRIADLDQIALAETEEEFRGLLEAAVSGTTVFRSSGADRGSSEAVLRFERWADGLLRRHEEGTETRERDTKPVRVLYIGGWGRSGSTLLDVMLGQVPGFFSAGELREGWLRGCVEDRLCGCGVPFLSCPFWSRVGEVAFGGWERADVGKLLKHRNTYDRPWAVPILLRSRSTDRGDDGLAGYVRALGRLYEAIRDVSGARVIVDSSKIPSHALLLRRIPGLDLRVVHLVRDSRGVVFSWQKRVRRPDAPGRTDYMLRYGTVAASARYVFYNLVTHLLPRLGVPYLFLRYEDLVAEPRRHLDRIFQLAGESPDESALGFLTTETVALQANHTVDGNPLRFATGLLRLRPDEEWRHRMPALQRSVVSAITAPLLLRYRYQVRTGAGRGRNPGQGR